MYDSDIAAEVKQNNSAYNQRVAAIKQDTSLSAEGKRDALKRVYDEAKTKHEQLIERNRSLVDQHLSILRTRAFGSSELKPLEHDSFRAALAAAAAAPSLEALAAAAEIAGDAVTLRAVAAAAVARDDAKVVAKLSTKNPALAEYREALRAVNSPTPQESIAEGFALSGPSPQG